MNPCIEKGCRVTIYCRVKGTDGEVIDGGSKPLAFEFGREQLLAELERHLEGKRAGHRIRVELGPEQAYGLHRPELVFEAVRQNLPSGIDLQPGTILSPGGSDGRFQLRVVSLTEHGAILDGNHPLAGRNLSFDLEVITVERAKGADSG